MRETIGELGTVPARAYEFIPNISADSCATRGYERVGDRLDDFRHRDIASTFVDCLISTHLNTRVVETMSVRSIATDHRLQFERRAYGDRAKSNRPRAT